MLFKVRGRREEQRYVVTGLTCSVVAHTAIVAIALYSKVVAPSFPEQQIVYSITIEGGKKLGGVAQVPDPKQQKAPPAPPKKVQAPEPPKKAEPEAVKVEPEKKVEEAKVEPPKEEEVVVIPEKKPTPKPTVAPKKATPAPKKTPAPERTPSMADINRQLQQAAQRYLGESTDAGGSGFGAGRVGGTQMGGGTVRPPEFFTYQQLLKAQVKSGWTWFDTSSELVAQVVFRISERGELSNVYLSKSSGNAGFDESVLRAVRKASPVPPPPPSVYEFFREVRITFDPRE